MRLMLTHTHIIHMCVLRKCTICVVANPIVQIVFVCMCGCVSVGLLCVISS